KWLNKTGKKGGGINLTVLRDGREVQLTDLRPSLRVSAERFGLGIALGSDEKNPIVGGTLEDSPAHVAGIPAGARILSINGQAVKNWFDVNNVFAALSPEDPVKILADFNGKQQSYTLGKLSADE